MDIIIFRMKKTVYLLIVMLLVGIPSLAEPIDRRALVERNCPFVSAMDTLASLSVGNGNFAFTVDATGLQSFPDYYKKGVCLGTQSQWGWHSFPNTEGYTPAEALRPFDFGHGFKRELYSCQIRDNERGKAASEYLRVNPHRLHLGIVGFAFPDSVRPTDVKHISQRLDLWRGLIGSHFSVGNYNYDVQTVCHPSRDLVAVSVFSRSRTPIVFRLPYPTGGHVDDACRWVMGDKHQSRIVEKGNGYAVVEHQLDSTRYFITVRWNKNAHFIEHSKHDFRLVPEADEWAFTFEMTERLPGGILRARRPLSHGFPVEGNLGEGNFLGGDSLFSDVAAQAAKYWQRFWSDGAAVDFSHCTDPRARELERRVVLSQYLLAIQSAGQYPPQETGLTMNSWYGKFHLEMILWHQAWQPLWGHTDLLERTLPWYFQAEPMARSIAARQGFKGIRWMKMTDPSGAEAPSNVGSFLIWQQPHLIYLAELAYRANHSDVFLRRFAPLVEQTAVWMADFATYDKKNKRYNLNHYIPAQESLKAAETYNSPFELSQWMCALQIAQLWRERLGQPRNKQWDAIVMGLAPLAASPLADSQQLYLAAESATDTYSNVKMTSDHPAILGAVGFFPMSRLVEPKVMSATLDWIFQNWNWPTSWGWDFPMAAMCATRMGEPQKAVEALLLPMQKNTYLPNGHNYQDNRLRIYLPGNGGLLSAIALMCAGWDGCTTHNPGFPDDGSWDVRWEGLLPMP